MMQSLSKNEDASNDPLSRMQAEVALLEAELERIERDLGAFESKIHSRLDREIARVRELFKLYKSQKKEKKAKRQEQKKKGKNYVAPKQVRLHKEAPQERDEREEAKPLNTEAQKALKRLYKEAVVQVHPDKFMHSGEHEKIQQAHAITAQLNGIYKRGDLEELINFYQYIIGENSSTESSSRKEVIPDSRLRLESLVKKKESILKQLEQVKSSYTYQVLTSYEDPFSFIDELHLQFMERIKQLEKRTRTGRAS